MKKKYKLLLLISNIFLLVFILNVFVSFIVFAKSWVNGLLIFALCLVNILIALRVSFDATENK